MVQRQAKMMFNNSTAGQVILYKFKKPAHKSNVTDLSVRNGSQNNNKGIKTNWNKTIEMPLIVNSTLRRDKREETHTNVWEDQCFATLFFYCKKYTAAIKNQVCNSKKHHFYNIRHMFTSQQYKNSEWILDNFRYSSISETSWKISRYPYNTSICTNKDSTENDIDIL